MKRRIFSSFIMIALGTMLATNTASAKVGSQTVDIVSGGINVVVDKVRIEPKDAKGKAVKPFIYNDTTYLPVRAIANALNMKVDWDPVLSTVYLTAAVEEIEGEPGSELENESENSQGDEEATDIALPDEMNSIGNSELPIDYNDIPTQQTIVITYSGIMIVVDNDILTPKDAKGNEVEPFISEGTTYLPVRALGEAVNKPVYWDGDESTVYIGEMNIMEDGSL